MLRLIVGGADQTNAPVKNSRERVEKEGRRRLREADVDRFLTRERLTGLPMPPALKAFMVQVEFAMEALSSLSPIPADIAADGYWPTYERAASWEAARA
jgi:hypothetical protein